MNPNQYTASDGLQWNTQEIVLYFSEYKGKMWCGTSSTLPVSALYQLCSQSKDGGVWMCGSDPVTLHRSNRTYNRRGEYLWCHEYDFVAGTNMRIFVRADDGQYLRTDSAFVPEMKPHGSDNRVLSGYIFFVASVILLSVSCILNHWMHNDVDL